MNNKKPKLFEIDGFEFTGKSTLINHLKNNLSNTDWSFCRLPGTSKLGEMLRPVVKTMNMEPNTSLGVALAGMSTAYYDMEKLHTNIITDRGLTSVILYQFIADNGYNMDPILAEAIFNSLRKQVEKSFDYYRIILTASLDTIKARKIRRAAEVGDKYDNFNNKLIEEMLYSYNNVIEDEAHFDITKTFKINVDNLSEESVLKAALEIIQSI